MAALLRTLAGSGRNVQGTAAPVHSLSMLRRYAGRAAQSTGRNGDSGQVIMGAGDVPCVVLAVGAREHQGAPGWGGYSVDKLALRHGAGVELETTDAKQPYARSRSTRTAGSHKQKARRPRLL